MPAATNIGKKPFPDGSLVRDALHGETVASGCRALGVWQGQLQCDQLLLAHQQTIDRIPARLFRLSSRLYVHDRASFASANADATTDTDQTARS